MQISFLPVAVKIYWFIYNLQMHAKLREISVFKIGVVLDLIFFLN